MNHFTYHVRLTKACNAECSYCSSWQAKPAKMTVDQYIDATKYIFETYLPSIGVSPEHITIQFIGGELLAYSIRDIQEIVDWSKGYFVPTVGGFSFGGQSNLIGSSRKVELLFDVFEGRIGTSFDNFSEMRTLAGSHENYRTSFNRSINALEESRQPIPGVVVLTNDHESVFVEEYRIANRAERDITFRPLFSAGLATSTGGLAELQARSLLSIFEDWAMKGRVKVEPLYSMFRKRVLAVDGLATDLISGCPSQKDCTSKSISLEPNGDMYLCQEMSDALVAKIGNAYEKNYDSNVVDILSFRQVSLSDDCISCDYIDSCQGGCMLEAYQHSSSFYDKPPLCDAWKTLYSAMDKLIIDNGVVRTNSWLRGL